MFKPILHRKVWTCVSNNHTSFFQNIVVKNVWLPLECLTYFSHLVCVLNTQLWSIIIFIKLEMCVFENANIPQIVMETSMLDQERSSGNAIIYRKDKSNPKNSHDFVLECVTGPPSSAFVGACEQDVIGESANLLSQQTSQ